jgi:hypothetical protein
VNRRCLFVTKINNESLPVSVGHAEIIGHVMVSSIEGTVSLITYAAHSTYDYTWHVWSTNRRWNSVPKASKAW